MKGNFLKKNIFGGSASDQEAVKIGGKKEEKKTVC
jgi:hypothetical protein